MFSLLFVQVLLVESCVYTVVFSVVVDPQIVLGCYSSSYVIDNYVHIFKCL